MKIFTLYKLPAIILVSLLFQSVLPNEVQAQTWYNASWLYRKAITIDYTKVGAGPHTNFPVLINITDANLITEALSTGNDILFTSSNGTTKLDHEIESYTSATGALVAWVQIPSLSSSANTVIYMYYGNSAATSQQNVTGTWDATFKGVYHLNNSSFLDATLNNYDGTNTGTIIAAGQIAGGRGFVRSDGTDYITISGMMSSPPNITLSAWAYLNSADGNGSEVISMGDKVAIRMNAGSTSGFFFDGSNWNTTSATTNILGGWHNLAYTFTSGGTSQKLYIDGTLAGTTSYTSTISYTSLGSNTIIGKHGNGGTGYTFDGAIDEVRVSNAVRSAGWILTEYNNQNSPETFYSVGAQTKTFTGTGNFSSPSNWTGGTLPVAGDNLVIDGTCTVDNNASTDNVAYGTLTIGSGTARTLNWVTNGTNRLNVTNVSGGTLTSTLNMTAGGTLIVNGTWTSTHLTFTPGTGTVELRSSINLPNTTYHNLVINASGITVGLSAATSITGDLTISSGTFIANNFNTTVTGAWVNNGTFTAGTGTVIFNGTTAISGTTTTIFNNLSITASSTVTCSTGIVGLTVNGTLTTATASILNLGTTTVLNGTLSSISNTGTIKTSVATSTSLLPLPTGKTWSGTGTVEYAAASGVQTVVNGTYTNLKLDNTTATNTVSGNITVGGIFTLTSGTITTGIYTIYSTGTIVRTSGYVIGNFQKNIPTGTTSKTFEIGDAVNYSPVTLAFTNVTTAGDLTASTASGDHSNISSSTLNATKSVNQTWTLINSSTNPIAFTSYNPTFTFVPGDVDAGATTGNFIVGRYNGGWTYPIVGTKTSTTTQATGITAFGDFQLGEICSIPAAAPTVTSPVNYCQNVTATQLTATGTNLVWGGITSGSAGVATTLSGNNYQDAVYNNKKTFFTTTTNNVTIQSVDYFVDLWQSTSSLRLGIFDSLGTLISSSSTIASVPGGGSNTKVTNIFNYTISTAGNYSIGIISGTGGLGGDNPTFPITETSGTINVTGVSNGVRCFTNIQFTTGTTASSTAPIPTTTLVGPSNYKVTQTVNGCASPQATIVVLVSAAPTTSAAGADQTGSATCGLTTVTLAANTPAIGTGLWSIVSGVGGTVTNPTSPTSTFSGVAGNTYTLRWTISNNSCTASTDDVTITFNQNPTVSAITTGTCVGGGGTGTITASAVGGSAPYTFSINAATYYTSALFTGLTANTYTLTAKSSIGCVGSTSVPIGEYAASTDDTTLTATDSWVGHMYDGTNFTKYIGHFTETETFDESFGGDATCFSVLSNTANSTYSSINTETFSVKYRMTSSKKGLYTVDLGSDDGSRLTVNGTILYNNWNDHSFNTNSSVLMNLTGNSPLLYEYYENGGSNEVKFNSLTLLLANTLSSNTTQNICIGNTGLAISGDVYGTLPSGIAISGTGYQWSYSTSIAGARTNITGATGATFIPSTSAAPFTTAGTYYIFRNAKLSSTNNVSPNPYIATNESNAAIITIAAVPTISVAGTDQTGAATCGLTTVTLGGNTPAIGTGTWSIISGTGGAIITPASPTSVFTGTAGNSYTLRWTIANGTCTASTDNVVITFNQNPTVSALTTESCVGGSTATITASAIGGTTPYTFNLSAGVYQSSGTFASLGAGTYPITAQSSAGCIGSMSVIVSEFAASTDDTAATATNSWVGHMYDGTAFSKYIGHFTEAETFDESFGGSATCFTVLSNSVARSIYTETFSVKYRMNSTKKGLYAVDLGSDDGSRLTVDGIMLYNNWTDQSFSTKSSVLMNLNGASSLLYEFYENATDNRVKFLNLTPILSNTLSTNTTQNICIGNTGSTISGDIFGTLPTGITLSGSGYQWSYSTTAGGTRISISGATGATFTPSAAAAPFNTAGTYYIYRNASLSSANNISPTTYIATNESNAATIIVAAIPTATISYTGSPYCSSLALATITQTGTTGGIYSSSSGLTLNSSTGAITPGTSTSGVYVVTYTMPAAGGCTVQNTTASVTISPAPSATISYIGNPFYSNSASAIITSTGTTGGTYSSTAGLSINAATGLVNTSASTAGTYTVTYTIAAGSGCAQYQATTTITKYSYPYVSYASKPDLGVASNFVLYTISGAVGNTGVSQITGNIGTNSGAITGFAASLMTCSAHSVDTVTAKCATDLMAAYHKVDTTTANFAHGAVLGNGETLVAGVYSIAAAGSAAGTLTLDAQGNSNATFIFKIGGAFTTGAATTINLVNGATACNVFWKAEGAISMGATTSMKGTLIANGAISLGAAGILEGRMLSIIGAVTVNTVTASIPACYSPTATTWTGVTNTDWNTTCNWLYGTIPTTTTNITIPGNLTNYPILNSGTGAVQNITIQSGASITVTGAKLQISGSISNGGTFTASNGTIEMNGTSQQNIPAAAFQGNLLQHLTINNNAGVNLNGNLNIAGILLPTLGQFNTGGYLTLLASASQAALIDGSGLGSVTGNVTMQGYLASAFGYHYISSPFQAAKVSQLSNDINLAATFPSLYKYDESLASSGWVNYTDSTGLLTPTQGYTANFGSTALPKTFDIKGVVNNGTISSPTLYNHNNTYTLGFNLIGNPYPSPIDMSITSGYTATNIDFALYYFDASTTDQYSGTYTSYINGLSTTGVFNTIVPAMQGFFVHVSNGTYPVTANLTFNNKVRITQLTPPVRALNGIDDRTLLRLSAQSATDATISDPVVVYFDDLATTAYDKELDALKLMNTDAKTPNLYAVSTDANNLSISAIPNPGDSSKKIPLGLETSTSGWLLLNASTIKNIPTGMHVYLSDTETGINQDLQINPTYRLYLAAGKYKNRFFLTFNKGLLTTTPETDTVASTELKIYSTGSNLMVTSNYTKATLVIINMLGQTMLKQDISGIGNHEIKLQVSSGIYLATLVSDKVKLTKKIFIRN